MIKDTLEVIKNCQSQENELKKENEMLKDYMTRHYAKSFDKTRYYAKSFDKGLSFEEITDMRCEDIAKSIKFQANGYLAEKLHSTILNMKIIDTWEPQRAKKRLGIDENKLKDYRDELYSALDVINISISKVDKLIEYIDNLKDEV